MDLTFTPEQEAFRREVRDFLAKELPPEMAFNNEFNEDDRLWAFAIEFTRKVGEKGWIGLTWPKEYGGLARSRVERFIMFEEFAYADAPLVNDIGWGLAAGSLLIGGTEEQKKRFLPPIAKMETFWVEGLTEPNAGSDLASLTTSAVRDGDDWVVNGQKTFTTWGARGEMIYLATRTDPNVPRHRGITVFGVDMKSPGISISPLYNLGGGRQNHTFFDNVRVPHDRLIGEEGRGWYYIMNAFYGGGGGGARHTKYQRLLDELVAYCKETRRRGRPLSQDPLIRAQLAEMAVMVEALRLLAYDGLSSAEAGTPPAYAGALPVVVFKETQARIGHLITRIVGPLSVLKNGRWAPLAGLIEAEYRQSYANHAGGASQVKRMVLATRGLGLPR